MLLTALPQLSPDQLRPQFHFTAPSGWLNDPNGLVFQNGEFHLFYQHNPFGTEWGNMTWGHAVSKDLFHWKDLPNAIEPDKLGTIFSGSAVVDDHNDAGFGARALLCFYTAAGGTSDASKGEPFTQCMAWSTDGKTFQKYAGNPIVTHIADENRDPKVVWDQSRRQWVMALYLANHQYEFLSSKNLKVWTKLSTLTVSDTDECPDFYPIDLDGDARKQKWVFSGANGHYLVGSFNGVEFHPETPVLSSYYGNTCYAAQTYSSAPNGRRIQIAWMNNATFPGCPWNQQMSLPTDLSLITTPEGPRLRFWPVEELDSLRKGSVRGHNGVFEVPDGLFDFQGEWTVEDRGRLTLALNGFKVTFDGESKQLSALDRHVRLDPDRGKLRIRAIADRTTLEIYAQNGSMYMPLFQIPRPYEFRGVQIETSWHGRAEVYALNGAFSPNRTTQ